MKKSLNIQSILKKLSKVKKRTWMIIGGAAVIILLLMFFILPKSVDIATAEVTRGEFIMQLGLRGEIDALNSMDVAVERMRRRVSLQIIDMVPEGTMVKKGDFLIQLDTAEAEQSITDAEEALENAKAALESEKASIASNMAQLESSLESEEYSYQQSELNLKSMQFEAEVKKQEAELNMKKADISLAQARERIKQQQIIDQTTIKKAELNVRQAELNLEEAKQALEMLTLRAPIDGLVVYEEMRTTSGRRKVQIGDTPFPGMAIIKIPDLSVMIVTGTIKEADINKIERGQNVIATVEALEGKTYYGKLTRVAALARRDESTNTKVFDVEATLDSTYGELRPGMTCDMTIITGRIENVLSVPLQSVFQKEDTTVVYVMGSRGPSMREVQVGTQSSNYVVVEEGLREGELVCLRDPTIPLQELGGESQPVVQQTQITRTTTTTQNFDMGDIGRAIMQGGGGFEGGGPPR
ncbi:efflux RND transporter periplasmic adaptor subunit [bacterium]|nr:efflux RND transporter periplasmic adaptor subunit [bacterium]